MIIYYNDVKHFVHIQTYLPPYMYNAHFNRLTLIIHYFDEKRHLLNIDLSHCEFYIYTHPRSKLKINNMTDFQITSMNCKIN